MTSNEARKEILDFFIANYNLITVNPVLGLDPLPSLAFDNLAKGLPAITSTWLRVTLRPGTGAQETLGGSGNRKFQRRGTLYIQIFTPLTKGMDASDYMGDNIIAFLEGGKTGNGIAFNQVTPPNDFGNDGSWNQANVTADYSYYETK